MLLKYFLFQANIHVSICCLVQGHWNHHAFTSWLASADLFGSFISCLATRWLITSNYIHVGAAVATMRLIDESLIVYRQSKTIRLWMHTIPVSQIISLSVLLISWDLLAIRKILILQSSQIFQVLTLKMISVFFYSTPNVSMEHWGQDPNGDTTCSHHSVTKLTTGSESFLRLSSVSVCISQRAVQSASWEGVWRCCRTSRWSSSV